MPRLRLKLVSLVAVTFAGVPLLPAANNVGMIVALSETSKVGSPVRFKRLIGSDSNVSFYIEAANITDGPVTLVARRGDFVETAAQYQNYMIASADCDAPRPCSGGILGIRTAAAEDFEPSRAEYRWDFGPNETRIIRINALCVIYDKDPLPSDYDGNFSFDHTERFDRLFRAVDRVNFILANPNLADTDVRISNLARTAVFLDRKKTINPGVYNLAIWRTQGVSRQQLYDKFVRPRLHGNRLDVLVISSANEAFDAAEELINFQR